MTGAKCARDHARKLEKPLKISGKTTLVKNVVRLISLLLLLALWLFAQTGHAQTFSTNPRVLLPSEHDPIPEELSLLDKIEESDATERTDFSNHRLADDEQDDQEDIEEVEFDLPAPVVSSESWSPGGPLFFRGELIALQRSTLNDFPLAFDATAGSERTLIIRKGQTGMSANTRLTLGKYLFRDVNNCDHSVSAVYYGLGEWTASGRIESVTDNALISEIDPFIGGFNLSDVQTFRYEANLDSIELNYRIQQRLGRDRLVMSPNGRWKQKAQTETLYSVLAGVRAVTSSEHFDYRAEGTVPASRRGAIIINTDNNLVGFQIGGDLTHMWNSFSLGVEGKAGSYVNFARERIDLTTVDPTLLEVDRHLDLKRNVLAFVGELSVTAKYQIRPNLAFRAAYEALFLNTVATAPDQLNFSDGSSLTLDVGSGQFFMGTSIGFEASW